MIGLHPFSGWCEYCLLEWLLERIRAISSGNERLNVSSRHLNSCTTGDVFRSPLKKTDATYWRSGIQSPRVHLNENKTTIHSEKKWYGCLSLHAWPHDIYRCVCVYIFHFSFLFFWYFTFKACNVAAMFCHPNRKPHRLCLVRDFCFTRICACGGSMPRCGWNVKNWSVFMFQNPLGKFERLTPLEI